MEISAPAMWINQTFAGFDASVTTAVHKLYELAGGFFTPFFEGVSFLGKGGICLILLSLLLMFYRPTRRFGTAMCLGLAIGWIVTNLIVKPAVARPRPYVDQSSIFYQFWLLVGQNIESDKSFPSGHTTAAFDCMTPVFILGNKRLKALALAFAGCVLVSGISGNGITPAGLLVGLGSGIGYGLYSILGTVALRKYSPYTVTAYTFLFAAAGSWVICNPGDMVSKFSAAPDSAFLLFFCCLTALATAVIPFLAYTLGLQTVEASKAGIIATIEPMVATLIGIVFFSEPLTILSGLGILLILGAIILLNQSSGTARES